MRGFIIGGATGGLVGAICSHLHMEPILLWTCIICSSILMSEIRNE